jgi:hypothetical protein
MQTTGNRIRLTQRPHFFMAGIPQVEPDKVAAIEVEH